MVTSALSTREPPTSRRQLLGINLHHGEGTSASMSDDGRMQAQLEGGTVAPEAHEGAHLYPRVTSFRSRRSALSEAQQQTWDRLWPVLGTQARWPDRPAGLLDTGAWFGRSAPQVLEIGCGTGTSTLAMAQAEPDVDVVAVEVYRRGLAQLLSAMDREHVTNIRLVRGDGVDVLEHMLSPASLTGVRVFFPDPWPKSRHHKRRLLQPTTVALIADRLRPGGVLHAATDHAGYAEQIAEVGDAEPLLRSVDPRTDRLPISVVRPITKYETKARAADSAVTELLWVKADHERDRRN
jgi:tRNA (guanine-N7-)-methyltransferase